MKKMITSGAVALGLLAGLATSASAVSQAGGIGLQFPIGARYNALGEAGTALSTDATAMWWNPGGFAFANAAGQQATGHFMYSPLVPGLADDVWITWLGGGVDVEGWGMVGAHLTYLSQGEQQGTDESGNETVTFNSYQVALGVNYAAPILDNLGVGVGVKYFRDELAPDDATQDKRSGSGDSWGFDFGVHYRPIDMVKLGVAYVNGGPDITFVDADQSDPMPKTLRLGTAVEVFRSELQRVTAVFDWYAYKDAILPGFMRDKGILVEDDDTTVIGAGAEWAYLESMFVRAGYKRDKEGDIVDATFGFGFDLERWTNQSINFDYASVPQADGLQRVHRFSFGFDF